MIKRIKILLILVLSLTQLTQIEAANLKKHAALGLSMAAAVTFGSDVINKHYGNKLWSHFKDIDIEEADKLRRFAANAAGSYFSPKQLANINFKMGNCYDCGVSSQTFGKSTIVMGIDILYYDGLLNFALLHELGHIYYKDSQYNFMILASTIFSTCNLLMSSISDILSRQVSRQKIAKNIKGAAGFLFAGNGLRSLCSYISEDRADDFAINCLKQQLDSKSLKDARDSFIRCHTHDMEQLKTDKLWNFKKFLLDPHSSNYNRAFKINKAYLEVKKDRRAIKDRIAE